MLFVLAGPSYVGKKTSVAHFMKLYSFSSIIPYTTKPYEHRIGETEGIQYHYVENSKDITNEKYIYDTPFQTAEYHEDTIYAYRKQDIENAINSDSNFIIHASMGNVTQIYKDFSDADYLTKETEGTRGTFPHKKLYFIFLNFKSKLSEEFFQTKLPKCKGANKSQSKQEKSNNFKRRFNHAKKEIDSFETNHSIFDEVVCSDKTYEICQKLEDVIMPRLIVKPTSPDKIPGPLSDTDILYMYEKNTREDSLKIEADGKLLNAEAVEKLISGCGIHVTLSNEIRKSRIKKFRRRIDMAAKEEDLKVLLSEIYPNINIENGYVLKPNEVILCTSEQSIKIPQDMYAMVGAKFSYTQLGLSIELSTSVIQSGHNGPIHFQIKNNTNSYICIYPHIEVAQIIFFRTIQNSSNEYHEQINSYHCYDEDKIPPCPKFRENNTVLDDKSKHSYLRLGKWIKKRLGDTIGTWIEGLLGVVVLALFVPYGIQNLNPFLQTIMNNTPRTLFLLLLAAIGCVTVVAIYALGMGIGYIARKLRVLYYNQDIRTKE